MTLSLDRGQLEMWLFVYSSFLLPVLLPWAINGKFQGLQKWYVPTAIEQYVPGAKESECSKGYRNNILQGVEKRYVLRAIYSMLQGKHNVMFSEYRNGMFQGVMKEYLQGV